MTTIRDALDGLWAADDQMPMIQQDGRWTTWGDVRVLAEAIDSQLTRIGCGEDARIGVVLENRPASIAALIAVLRAGRTIITLNPMQPIPRLSSDLANAAADCVLAGHAFWGHDEFTSAVTRCGAAGFDIDGRSVTQTVSGDPRPQATPPTESVAIEMFTSGTTGPPKRIPLTWRQLESALNAVHGYTGKGGRAGREMFTGRIALVTLPIVHIGGLWGVLQNIAEARPFVMLHRFTIEGWVDAVREHKPKVAGLPPAAMRSLLQADVDPADLSSLSAITAGTTVVDPDLADEFTRRFDCAVLVMYGATEFSGAIAGWTMPLYREWWTQKRGSVGKAFPGVNLRVVAEDGKVLGDNESGRLEVRSGQAGTGGREWIRTSDLARLDHDGFLYIEGRVDDAIVRGGFKVQPELVAATLRNHDAVLDATVYGRADERLGQVPVAVVQLVDGETAFDEDEVKTFCRGHLTPYEVPTRIFVLPELPRNVSLKVDRRRLLELIAELELLEGAHKDQSSVGARLA
ncbi:class I adenylate-forming enzyme family protein [Gordonia sp. KTR9]|uniref:class I adenylate-forming enzyme family protein n=1 Tax=Gordonia sp. KTR9 TaxID=337191 RepID=UPI00027DE9F3|nr:fatty acid--CoA ligase family protein [Gordonia sp. KTR9]AFR49430.1 Acyl-CoA synthetases (AMP-forming)/AMP-acid ligases II [Gordonia sp. KTR9]